MEELSLEFKSCVALSTSTPFNVCVLAKPEGMKNVPQSFLDSPRLFYETNPSKFLKFAG